jgi:DNA gyrase/topoisomerase IV subunit A
MVRVTLVLSTATPPAMRYTEIRMSKIAHELMADLEKETVDFVDNYDGTGNP